MSTNPPELKTILEAALLAAGEALSINRLQSLFDDQQKPSRDNILNALHTLMQEYEGRGIELAELAGGYRIQVRQTLAPWITRLWQERPGRYSRALLETLALIAYRQPITRGEIAEIRGVAVSTNIMKTLQERAWVKVIGHREVPGRPELFATTREFLDYFNLKSLSELPALADLRDLDAIGAELAQQMSLNLQQPLPSQGETI